MNRYTFYSYKQDFLQHKGYMPKNPHKEHKYVDIIDGRYIYPEDLEGLNKSKKSSVPSKAPSAVYSDQTQQKPQRDKKTKTADRSNIEGKTSEEINNQKTQQKLQNAKNNIDRLNGTQQEQPTGRPLNTQEFKNAQAEYVNEYANIIRQSNGDTKSAAQKYFQEDEDVDYLLWEIEDGLKNGTLTYVDGKFQTDDDKLKEDMLSTANWIKGWTDKIGAASGSGQAMEKELGKLLKARIKELGEQYQNEQKEKHEATMNAVANATQKFAAQQESKSKKKEKKQTEQEMHDELTELGKGGNVDLNNRPEISTEELIKAGWKRKDVGDGYATVFSSTEPSEDGKTFYNFTPIVVDPKTGEYQYCLSPDEFKQYCWDVIDGKRDDDLNLQMGGAFTGKNAAKKAENAAIRVHELHEKLHNKKKKGSK